MKKEIKIKNSWDDLTLNDWLSLIKDSSIKNYLKVLTDLTDTEIEQLSPENKETIEKEIAFVKEPPFYSDYKSFVIVNGYKYEVNKHENFTLIEQANMSAYLTDLINNFAEVYNILYKPLQKNTPTENILNAKLKDVYGYYVFFCLYGSSIQKIINTSLEQMKAEMK